MNYKNKNPQKILLISFDHWGYDSFIVDSLRQNGVEDSHHIKLSDFKYPNIFERLKNVYYKLFTRFDYKYYLREQYILKLLNFYGYQDQILLINPETFTPKFIEILKKHTKRLIAYQYDSMHRNNTRHLLEKFDKVFTFDIQDSKDYHIEHLPNYMYLPIMKNENNTYNHVISISSYDERFPQFIEISRKLNALKISHTFYIVGKKSVLKNFEKLWNKELKIFVFTGKKFGLKSLLSLYKNSSAILDVLRNNQTGLSFRVFEALSLEKKLITTNQSVKMYEFYNPTNILILGEEELTEDFFLLPYAHLNQQNYASFELQSWIKKVFSL